MRPTHAKGSAPADEEDFREIDKKVGQLLGTLLRLFTWGNVLRRRR